jgi:hypothetical protein
MTFQPIDNNNRIDAWARRHLAAFDHENRQGNERIGAGIAVTKSCVVTAQHVVQASGSQSRVHIGGQSALGTVTAFDYITDLAIVKLEEPIAEPAVFLFGMETRLSEQQSRLIALGYPHKAGDQSHFEQAEFAPRQFEHAKFGYRIVAGTGLDEGFSGGPLILADHPALPVVGLTQEGGGVGQTSLRHPNDVVRYLLANGIRPKTLPAWELPEVRPSRSEEKRLWANALGLPGTAVLLRRLSALSGNDAHFIVVPTDNGTPVLMMNMVLARRHFGLENGRCVMTGFEPSERLQAFLAHAARDGLRLPSRVEWARAFRRENQSSPEPWPIGTENAAIGTVPPRGPLGPYRVNLAPPGHWEVVSSETGALEVVAPPMSSGGALRSVDFNRPLNPASVVLRLCMDLPYNPSTADAQNAQWETEHD